MSLTPVPSEQPTSEARCANCSAPLVGDQRYCLSCGRPVSPVRLPFLDVLGAEPQPGDGAPIAVAAVPAGYATVIEPPGGGPFASLRRYSGLFGLLAVLLLATLAGLLVGHWVTQSKAPAKQILEVKGLPSATVAAPLAATAAGYGGGASAAPTSPSAPASTSGSATAKAAAAKTEAHEAKEAKAIEKAPPPKAVKKSPTQLRKLGNTTGRKHEEEVNALGAQPIETG